MKKLLAIAALLLASTAAQAQYTFEYGGRTIRVDPDRGTVSIPGVYDNSGRRPKRSRSEDSDRPRKQPPQQAKTDPQAPPAEAAVPPPAPAGQTTPAPAIAAPAPVPAASEPATTTATVAPADTAVVPPPSPPAAGAPEPQVQQEPAPAPNPVPAPAVAAVTPPPPAAPQAADSPLGVWLTEEKEGKVRIEQCGANLCGYSVDKRSNQNGEQVLINMKPGKDKWSGRILDPNTGSTYDSTIALQGTDTLRVQGCAFGGVFCGGQTWTRVN
jgi:uncharacterized protein (DUF2147 family)